MRLDTETLRSDSGIKKTVMTAWPHATVASGTPFSRVISNIAGMNQTYFHAILELCRLKHCPFWYELFGV
jgi:hypothetical protein